MYRTMATNPPYLEEGQRLNAQPQWLNLFITIPRSPRITNVGLIIITFTIARMLYFIGLGLADEKDITVKGLEIVKRAVESPLRALAANAGVEGSLVVQEVKRRKGNEGYNVSTGGYEDLVKAGVVDPKKVTRTALQNAASIAGLLLTTECLVTEIPEKEKKAAPGGGHGMGGGEMDY